MEKRIRQGSRGSPLEKATKCKIQMPGLKAQDDIVMKNICWSFSKLGISHGYDLCFSVMFSVMFQYAFGYFSIRVFPLFLKIFSYLPLSSLYICATNPFISWHRLAVTLPFYYQFSTTFSLVPCPRSSNNYQKNATWKKPWDQLDSSCIATLKKLTWKNQV